MFSASILAYCTLKGHIVTPAPTNEILERKMCRICTELVFVFVIFQKQFISTMAVFSSSKNEILLIWFHHLAMSQVCFVVQQKPIHKGIQLAVFFFILLRFLHVAKTMTHILKLTMQHWKLNVDTNSSHFMVFCVELARLSHWEQVLCLWCSLSLLLMKMSAETHSNHKQDVWNQC